jgi:hypothetical protein
MDLGKMSPGIFPHTSGREEGYMGGLNPGLGSVTISPGPWYGTHIVVTLGVGMFDLARFC